MNEPRNTLILKVDDRVFAYLGKLAADQGGAATLYAQQLFEAAYPVRCGVAQDEPLAAAIAAKTERRPAPAAPQSVVVRADPDQVQRDAQRVAAAERHAAQMAEERRAIAETLEDERRAHADNLKVASEALELTQAETAQLRRELAEVSSKNELLNGLEKSAKARADGSEERVAEVERLLRDHACALEMWIACARQERSRADEASRHLNERASLWSEISGLQRVSAKLASVATALHHQAAPQTTGFIVPVMSTEALDAVYGWAPPAARADEPFALPAAQRAPKARKEPSKPAADHFIWKKSWGRSR